MGSRGGASGASRGVRGPPSRAKKGGVPPGTPRGQKSVKNTPKMGFLGGPGPRKMQKNALFRTFLKFGIGHTPPCFWPSRRCLRVAKTRQFIQY